MVKKPGYIHIPKHFPRTPSTARQPDADCKLGQQLAQAHLLTGNFTGYQLITDAQEALNWRIELIKQAQYSVDLQYYTWQRDTSGTLLMSYVLAAAERGVRIRLLLDDIHFRDDMNTLAINHHPNIEIRLFNPFESRRFTPLTRPLEWLTSFDRVNHRMHNKLIVADNLVAMCGGRNIADEYFGRSVRLQFVDLDLLTSGNAVTNMSSAFDTFWNSHWAVPVNELRTMFIDKRKQRLTQRLIRRFHRRRLYAQHAANWQPSFASMQRASAKVLFDDPDKVNPAESTHLPETSAVLWQLLPRVKKELCLITPYLIPTQALVDVLQRLIARGVKIRILTNSLASNDVAIAHAHYRSWRTLLLDSRIRLYELAAYGGETITKQGFYSLHAKAMVLDDDKVFIGTHNADPRSINLNTEMGLLVNSHTLARQVKSWFHNYTGPYGRAWRVRRWRQHLIWRRQLQHSSEITRTEPDSRWYRRMLVRVMGWLPISHLL